MSLNDMRDELKEKYDRGKERQEPITGRVILADDSSFGADESIVDILKAWNDAGHETIMSCSGNPRDHPGARCGWDMGEAYVSFNPRSKPSLYGSGFRFDPAQVNSYSMELYNAIEEAGWSADYNALFLGAYHAVTARPKPHFKNKKWILYGTIEGVDPEKEATVKALDSCEKQWCKALTDEVMDDKWNRLFRSVMAVKAPPKTKE